MKRNLTRRIFVAAAGVAAISAALAGMGLAGCAGSQGADASASSAADASASAAASSAAAAASSHRTSLEAHGIDYLALVNKQHKLPDGWEDAVDITHFTNSEGWDVDVEVNAYDAYLALKEDLEAEDGVYVDLDSAYRSVADQQRIVDEFTEKYGAEYVKKYVAVPGYSEHHTGLALDLFLIVDGKAVVENEDMVTYPEIWDKIHARLADHAFILRYLPGKKIFTGYSYEPWHIRYVYDPSIAQEIMDAGMTFEEYLDAVDPCVAGCVVDYGKSKIYEEPDMDAALEEVLAEFSGWGCTMQRFAYAGDEAAKADLDYVNSLRKEGTPEFDQAIVFTTDFHSPSAKEAEGTAWKPDSDYKDYTWHLGRTGTDGAWQLLTWGY